jgi:DNA-binding beta-propeller fold protein YncE
LAGIITEGSMQMKHPVFNRYALSICVAAAILAGCGGSQPPIGAPGAMQLQVAHHERAGPDSGVEFAYVTNDGSNNIFTYTINLTSGALKQVKGSPFGAGTEPLDLAVDPTGRFAYVTNDYPYDVYGYRINAASGALTQMNESPFGAGIGALGVAVAPNGKFVFTANLGYGFSSEPGNVSAYRIDARSGALTQVEGSPFWADDGPYEVAVDPMGKFAYVINWESNDICAYRIDARSGGLTQVTGSPFATGIYPDGLAVAPTGKFVFVANNSSGNVSAYRIDAVSGALTQVKGSPFETGTYPWDVAVDPTGRFVYVANNGSSNVSAYAIDAVSGALKPVKGSPFAAGSSPLDVAVDPTAKFAYVTNNGGVRSGYGNISAYIINATSGALTQVKGSPFAAGTNPYAIAICRVNAGRCSAAAATPPR